MFAVAVVGEDWLISAVLQAVLQVMASIEAPNPLIRMVVIPTREFLPCILSPLLTLLCAGAGVAASRLSLMDEGLGSSLPLDTDWAHITAAPLVQYVDTAQHTHSMPVAHVIQHRLSASESS